MDTLANMNNYWGNWAGPLTILGFTMGGLALLIILAWCVYWKGRGLWRAAKNDNKKWFVALIILNTAGILEIIYIFKIAKKSWADVKKDFRDGWNSIGKK